MKPKITFKGADYVRSAERTLAGDGDSFIVTDVSDAGKLMGYLMEVADIELTRRPVIGGEHAALSIPKGTDLNDLYDLLKHSPIS
jgi:hypothetical protein